MKIIKNTHYLLFALAFVAKLLHMHYHTYVLLIIAFSFLIFTSVNSIKSKKSKLSIWNDLFLSLTMFTCIFLAKFLSFAYLFYGLSIALGLGILFLQIKQNYLQHLILTVAIISVLTVLQFLPTHIKYYWLNVKFNHEIAKDYFTMNRYALLLYHNGKLEQAKVAVSSAKSMALDAADERSLEFIHQNEQLILDAIHKVNQ